MEEEVFTEDFQTWESRLVDRHGRMWAIHIDTRDGYPPTYTVKLNGKKWGDGPFEDRDAAHNAALVFIDAGEHADI